MVTRSIEFEGGLPIDLSSVDDTLTQINKGLSRFNVEVTDKALPEGEHYVTPDEWEDPNFDYFVRVNPDGSGEVRMKPTSDKSKSKFIEEENWTSGERIHPVTHNSIPTLIAGGSKQSPTGHAIYKIIYWSKD